MVQHGERHHGDWKHGAFKQVEISPKKQGNEQGGNNRLEPQVPGQGNGHLAIPRQRGKGITHGFVIRECVRCINYTCCSVINCKLFAAAASSNAGRTSRMTGVPVWVRAALPSCSRTMAPGRSPAKSM